MEEKVEKLNLKWKTSKEQKKIQLKKRSTMNLLEMPFFDFTDETLEYSKQETIKPIPTTTKTIKKPTKPLHSEISTLPSFNTTSIAYSNSALISIVSGSIESKPSLTQSIGSQFSSAAAQGFFTQIQPLSQPYTTEERQNEPESNVDKSTNSSFL